MTAFFDFPAAHWTHLRTTNVVESPFAAVRLRTSAAKRFKRVEGATALIWKLLRVAEKRFRKLNAPHLLEDRYGGDPQGCRDPGGRLGPRSSIFPPPTGRTCARRTWSRARSRRPAAHIGRRFKRVEGADRP